MRHSPITESSSAKFAPHWFRVVLVNLSAIGVRELEGCVLLPALKAKSLTTLIGKVVAFSAQMTFALGTYPPILANKAEGIKAVGTR